MADQNETGSNVEHLSSMLTVNDVAEMLRCSSRSVYRLSDSGQMPRPCKLGALVRWPREKVQRWIADGCPNCRTLRPRRDGGRP